MSNPLVQIDKKLGTEYAIRMQSGSFMGYVNYIEMQFQKEWGSYEALKNLFEQYKAGAMKQPINRQLIIDFLQPEATDNLSEVIEYTVDFFTKQYKLSDFDEIKEKLIQLSTDLMDMAAYRHDNFDALATYLREAC